MTYDVLPEIRGVSRKVIFGVFEVPNFKMFLSVPNMKHSSELDNYASRIDLKLSLFCITKGIFSFYTKKM